ncbi:AbrB/MazE/SpoVT family DNA-binding domain-containing protein [Candidatus Woesearchaeota archaeon]|nr:AbrB/MazE/SpoVT family DNA-binding domain-containing protein [Candidatus Woesearchaeota archaeon]
MTSVVVTRNYQITLPREVRKRTDIAIGETMLIETKGDDIIIKKIKEDPVKAAFGLWRGKIKESSIEYVDKLRETWKDRER